MRDIFNLIDSNIEFLERNGYQTEEEVVESIIQKDLDSLYDDLGDDVFLLDEEDLYLMNKEDGQWPY